MTKVIPISIVLIVWMCSMLSNAKKSEKRKTVFEKESICDAIFGKFWFYSL